jgi:hypothetical protein
MADGQGSPRAEGSGPVSGTQITVSVGGLVGKISGGVGDAALGDEALWEGALGDEAADACGLIEGAGAHPTSKAQSRTAKIFIVSQTVRSPSWLRMG